MQNKSFEMLVKIKAQIEEMEAQSEKQHKEVMQAISEMNQGIKGIDKEFTEVSVRIDKKLEEVSKRLDKGFKEIFERLDRRGL